MGTVMGRLEDNAIALLSLEFQPFTHYKCGTYYSYSWVGRVEPR